MISICGPVGRGCLYNQFSEHNGIETALIGNGDDDDGCGSRFYESHSALLCKTFDCFPRIISSRASIWHQFSQQIATGLIT